MQSFDIHRVKSVRIWRESTPETDHSVVRIKIVNEPAGDVVDGNDYLKIKHETMITLHSFDGRPAEVNLIEK